MYANVCTPRYVCQGMYAEVCTPTYVRQGMNTTAGVLLLHNGKWTPSVHLEHSSTSTVSCRRSSCLLNAMHSPAWAFAQKELLYLGKLPHSLTTRSLEAAPHATGDLPSYTRYLLTQHDSSLQMGGVSLMGSLTGRSGHLGSLRVRDTCGRLTGTSVGGLVAKGLSASETPWYTRQADQRSQSVIACLDAPCSHVAVRL